MSENAIIAIKPNGRINLEKCILYFVLLTAFFNDWMRYGSSDITLFRIVIIPGLLICMVKKTKVFLKTFLLFAFFLFIDLIQSIIFAYSNLYGIPFSLFLFIEYAYFYFCIFAVICFTYVIFEMDRENFQRQFFSLLKIIGIIYMLIMVFEGELRGHIYIANINNYGTYLTAIFPVFLYETLKEKKVGNAVFCIATYILLFVKDCKLDLLGVVLETGIIILLLLKNSRFQEIRFFSFFFMFSFIFACILLINSPLRIHEYELKGIIKEPIWRILTGTPYAASSSSTSYRTNVIIMGMEEIKKTYMLGIGGGNSARLFRSMIPSGEIISEWIKEEAISLHNTWMEICIEFGFLGISFCIWIFVRVWKIFCKKRWSKFQIIAITVGISVWVWIMAPSGIVTSYFLICLFAGLFIVNMDHNRGEKKV